MLSSDRFKQVSGKLYPSPSQRLVQILQMVPNFPADSISCKSSGMKVRPKKRIMIRIRSF